MMVNLFYSNLLGLAAGAAVTSSSIPKLWERFSNARRGHGAFNRADLYRDALQAFGNGIWVLVGALSGLLSVALFCLVNSALLSALILLNLRGHCPPVTEKPPGSIPAVPAAGS